MADRKLFGTDGIRGKANIHPMTGEVAFVLGRAVTYYFQNINGRESAPLIILGKDTRRSCYMLEQAFSAGVCAQGGKVVLTGPLPTPGVAFVTRSMRADAGVMISASHNPFDDNGIKIFDAEGYKLPDAVEFKLEKIIEDPSVMDTPTGADLGRAQRLDEVLGRYVVRTKAAVDDKMDFDGMRIVLDCANGAAYRVAPKVFNELGAEVLTLGDSPNGQNINEACGSLHPENCRGILLNYRADIGICLDGDADRVIFVDEKGKVVEGDKVIAMFVKLLFESGKLKKGDSIVGTVMSNIGLEQYVKSLGLNFIRAKVGDRYIIEEMKKTGSLLGGEPSGHIILSEYASTGDGTLAGLKMLELLKITGKKLSELASEFVLYPQLLKNLPVTNKVPFEEITSLQTELKSVKGELGDRGRVLLRYSGTENLARVMVEGEDLGQIKQVCDRLCHVLEKALA